MERLLEMAGKAADQAEIYFLEHQSDQIQFENGRLKEIESKMQSGLSLRIIKDGCLGFAYTKNLLNPEDLLRQALDSLKGKVEAPFDFPSGAPLPSLKTDDPHLQEVTNSALVEEGSRVCEYSSRPGPGSSQCLHPAGPATNPVAEQPGVGSDPDQQLLFSECLPVVSRVPGRT